jgi:hypothetical protein
VEVEDVAPPGRIVLGVTDDVGGHDLAVHAGAQQLLLDLSQGTR